MTGDLRVSASGNDTVRLLGCTDLTAGKGFSIALGNVQNQLNLSVPQAPVNLDTEYGFQIRSGGRVVCRFDDEIRVNGHRITNLPEPQDDNEPATKSYVDRNVNTCDIYKCGPTIGEESQEQWYSLNLSHARTPTITRFDEERLGVVILNSGFYRFSIMGQAVDQIQIGIFPGGSDRGIVRHVNSFFAFTEVLSLAGSPMYTVKIKKALNAHTLRLHALTLLIEKV